MPKVCPEHPSARRSSQNFVQPWPFAQWGLDIVGPFPKVAGNKRYLLVGTNYFTKWVEVEPLANIRDVDAKKFKPLFQIMNSNLIARPSEDTVAN